MKSGRLLASASRAFVDPAGRRQRHGTGMERLGFMAPRGDVDKVPETVVNNLEVA